MADWIEQFFGQESRALGEKIGRAVLAGELETVLNEFSLLRVRVAEAMKNELHRCCPAGGKQEQGQDLIELQTEMNLALDGQLSAALKTLIESRIGALAEAAWRD